METVLQDDVEPLPNPAVYIAARYSRKLEIKGLASLIRKAGITVVSTWHDKPDFPFPESAIEEHATEFSAESIADLNELGTANTLIFMSEDPNVGIPRAGRHVEYGYFLRNKRT